MSRVRKFKLQTNSSKKLQSQRVHAVNCITCGRHQVRGRRGTISTPTGSNLPTPTLFICAEDGSIYCDCLVDKGKLGCPALQRRLPLLTAVQLGRGYRAPWYLLSQL